MPTEYYVITFHSTFAALQFEKTTKDQSWPIRLVPVPRQISSSCGLAMRVSPSHIAAVAEFCTHTELDIDTIYHIFDDKSKPPQPWAGWEQV